MVHKRLIRRLLPAAAVALLISTTGCATNPATGKTQLSLYSEAQEVEIGRSSDPQIVAQYGVYDDPELAAYVDRIGQKLASESERPDLPWTFRVLDDPVINAFALPGGFIYVTRGILGHMSSEEELAAVLGHEVGHVTARHGVNRMSKAQIAGLGLGLGAVLAPELAQSVGGLAQQGMQLLFLKYGRDAERQADSLGFRYADTVGYNPRGFLDMFAMLSASNRAAGGTRLPGYLLTHPEPERRLEAARAQIGQMPQEVLDRPVYRQRFMQHLEDMPFGPNPQEGFFVDNDFVHPGMRLRLELPEGWTAHNQRTAVVAVSPKNDAILQLGLAQERSVEEAARAFYNSQGITVRSSWRDTDPDLPLEGTRTFATTNGEIYGAAGFIETGGVVLRLLAVSKTPSWSRYENVLERSLRSFSTLHDKRYLNPRPAKIQLVTLNRDMTLEEFNRKYPSTINIQQLGLLNHVEPGGTLKKGTRAKRVRGFDPGPQVGVKLPRRP